MERFYSLKKVKTRNIQLLKNKDNCPLEQKCNTANIVYKAKVASSNLSYQEKVYFGLCEITF